MPLIDPSESRYALVAKMMADSGHFLVPQLINHQGVSEPFWGKPPLFFWAVSLSYKIFGSGEAASRVPSFLAMFAAALALFLIAKRLYGLSVAWTASLLLLTSGLFFVYGGLCQVDMLFTAFLGWGMLGFIFWHTSTERKNICALIFSSAIAGAFLTKGPLVLALLSITLFPWYLLCRQKQIRLAPFPWFSSSLIAFSLTAPWYVLAERESPGIIRYFFFNENFMRFLVKNYGDRYGFSHEYFFGTIWLFALAGTLPWCLFGLVPSFWRQLRFRAKEDLWTSLLLLWGISPALMFTFSHHILLSYALPGIPGLSLAVAVSLHRFGQARLPSFLRKVARPVSFLLLAVALIAFSLIFSRLGISVLPVYNFEVFEALLGLAVMVFVLSVMRKHWHPQGVLSIVVGLCLFVASASAAILTATAIPAAAFQPYLSERFPPNKYELNFPFGIPYSAYVYLPHELESAPEEILLPDDDDDITGEAMLVPDEKVSQFELALSKSTQPFRFVTKLGTWKVYERCQPEEADKFSLSKK